MSKADRTKQYIIEKTACIFNTKGYAGTSINDLIEATGLTKGSIYGNFENKDQVALAAFDYNFERLVLYIRSKMDAKETVVEKLLVYPETYRNFLTNPILISGCPVTNTSTEADDTHPLLRDKVEGAYNFWKNSLENHINNGISSGEIKSDLNINEFISVFISIMQGGILQAKVTKKMNSLNSSMDYLERYVLSIKK
ncbi:TetR/AcrR family transcriptional regulator [Flavobacterium amnicola]|uniref:TetR/AcrR family transcriptional regulator n=1 Tax=Flavobacterium amnicola TaxID=2506422 RepID=A0A4Q1K312_9FLAO|nr:TetR/AcrR family transcriptional regulator [Flavobacterium amnicola]RXR18369.1 TetR/AcrR family transcriptional regulator [Flavobacterium amnicola]